MKKNFVFFVFISCFVAKAQNPDGQNVSLHVTPLWSWGKADYNRISSVWYPPTQASDAQSVQTTDIGILDYPYAFGINALIKVPTASFATVSVSYSFNQNFQRYGTENIKNPYFSQFWSVNGYLHTVSMTLSLYNLFSIYQQ